MQRITTTSRAQTHLLVLAPGTRMPIDDPRLTRIAVSLAARGIDVVRFEFASSEDDAGMERDFIGLLDVLPHPGPRVIGGWSRGARIAARVAPHIEVDALLCLSYPFHPIGQPNARAAVETLAALELPTLIVQGSRDAFGNREQVRGYRLPASIELQWQRDANHALEPRQRSGIDAEQQFDHAIERIARFVLAL